MATYLVVIELHRGTPTPRSIKVLPNNPSFTLLDFDNTAYKQKWVFDNSIISGIIRILPLDTHFLRSGTPRSKKSELHITVSHTMIGVNHWITQP